MIEPNSRRSAALYPANGRVIVNALGTLSDPNRDSLNGNSMSARVLSDAKASGLTAVNLTLAGMLAGVADPFEETVRAVAHCDAKLRRHPEDLLKIFDAADIIRAKAEGKIGVIYGFQNAVMMGDNVNRVDIFADLGVRVVQLTYNSQNQIGGGANSAASVGITPFAREVIDRLNDRRLMIDLSHSSEQTCIDAARASKAPVSINHTGCRALADTPRNKSDVELRLVAERGGFVGIYFMGFLNLAKMAGAEDLVAHIDHAVNICGEDHVGLGTDGPITQIDDVEAYKGEMDELRVKWTAMGVISPGSEGTYNFLSDLRGPDQFHKLADLLAHRGYSSHRIDKILGLNYLNFATEVWSE